MRQLFVHLKEVYDSIGIEIAYTHNILIELGIHMKMVRLVKMYRNETYSIGRLGKRLSDMLPIRNSLKQGDIIRRVQ